MAKHLYLGEGASWRLAADTNVDGLTRTIENAMKTPGEVLQLPVLLRDRPDIPVTLLLNAAATPWVVLTDLED